MKICGYVDMWILDTWRHKYARVHPKLIIDCTDPRVVCCGCGDWRSSMSTTGGGDGHGRWIDSVGA